ncbi:hypothetical protein [Aneurinibacillus migulanus]|uniref:Uncharacterized protein n=1 Tax=Aneurinibacillus migulanus TaxID=47500 RepID=A0A0D1YFL5_ANEMI|nr:hypothetical protein [Aneurinibacillus migulanus]KIV57692.1 hypothetical protein TS65_09225 [Aneurinibacillus migulanus]KON95872.1 hypothetical protein AF333_10635 [Aneurinibacillus migulanus]MED0891963.1 hypothetical protein [Aneurinibacillus migulanus]MED1617297.1 hypothetical protein [Aneurinibacillus migulanus]SDK26726.1 hypothetical protein SAMN04487909_14633 [Aneurinibacillus migulanus]
MKKKLIAAIMAVSVVVGGNYASAAPVQQKAVKTYTENDIQTVKLYSQISNMYINLQDLNRGVGKLSEGLSLAYNDMRVNGSSTMYTNVQKAHAQFTDLYSKRVKEVQALARLASANKINVSDMNTILEKSKIALEQYDEALQALNNVFENPNEYTMNQYVSKEKAAYKKISEGEQLARQGYQRFYNIIQKY